MAACFRETSRPWLTVTTVVVTVCIVALSIANAVTSPVDGAKQFARSLSDEFSDAIGNDVAMIATTYALMFVYLLVALSRWDPVHSMIGLSFVVILIVALSYAGCLGLGGLLGVKNNALTNNIPFLLLGLGVDDAFVLVSEFQRATRLDPSGSVESRCAAACRFGGMSILITSATDGE